jgi:hypothetical protein
VADTFATHTLADWLAARLDGHGSYLGVTTYAFYQERSQVEVDRRGSKAASSWSVGGRHFNHHFWSIGWRSVSVPFAQKWLKSSGRSCLTSVDRLKTEASMPSMG